MSQKDPVNYFAAKKAAVWEGIAERRAAAAEGFTERRTAILSRLADGKTAFSEGLTEKGTALSNGITEKRAAVLTTLPSFSGSTEKHGDLTKQTDEKKSGVLTGASDRIVSFGGGAVGFVSEYREHRRQLGRAKSANDIRAVVEKNKQICGNEQAWVAEDSVRGSMGDWDSWDSWDSWESTYDDRISTSTPLPSYQSVSSPYRILRPLPCPVIIPQRRPGDHSRGFMRAYAPVLADSGIPQATFLYFLKDFYDSSKASPIFVVVQIGGGFIGMIPDVHAQMISQFIGPLAVMGMKTQARLRTNKFLHRANKLLFEPAGMIAAIVKYNPDADGENGDAVQLQEVDVSNKSVFKTIKLNATRFVKSKLDNQTIKSMNEKLRVGSETTKGSLDIPEAAPLIFPDSSQRLEHPETLKDRWRDFNKTLNDYNDRRAHIRYGEKDPHSALVLPAEQMKLRSAVADPNHPINKNGFKGLFSGGKSVDVDDTAAGTNAKAGDQRADRGSLSPECSGEAGESDLDLAHVQSHNSGKSSNSGGSKSKLDKMLQKNILYLMIVNLPSEEEVWTAEGTLVELPA